ncbi:hypothetical protein AO375_1169 [Moraxella catarrhalis]|nr:hypothetical protein AO375_1169 [Moraxella catarrhalis]
MCKPLAVADTRCIDAKFHLHQSNLKHPKKIPMMIKCLLVIVIGYC